MLEPFEKIVPLLVCPKSGQPLTVLENNMLVSIDSANAYEFLGTRPVLVDYSRSVISEDELNWSDGASVVVRARRSVVRDVARRLVRPSPKKTASNIDSMIRSLKQVHENPCILVIGGGSIGAAMEPLYEDPNIRLIAFDIYDSANIQFIADAHSIPLANCSIDGVVAQAVLEHVLEPCRVVSEIHRVLRDGGLVYAETPFMQQVHEGAYDFTRFSDSGHRYLFRNFEAERSGALHGAADQLIRSIDYFFRSVFRSRRIGKLAKMLFFWIKYFDYVIPETYAVDAASAVFFLGRKSDSSITPTEAVAHYRGAQT